MIEIGTGKAKNLRRITREEYGFTHRKRKIVLSLASPDLITVREFKSRQSYSVRVWDLFVWRVRCEAEKAHMEKLRLKKQKKAERLARRRIDDADRRLRQRIRQD
jgi:hypothetical protein